MKSNNDISKLRNKTIALVLDGFINGLGVARSLKVDKELIVVGVTWNGSPISYSNAVDHSFNYDEHDELLDILIAINKVALKVVPYYCSDRNVQLLWANKSKLDHFSIPYSDLNLLEKNEQIRICQKVGILVPKSWTITDLQQIKDVDDGLVYIVKPTSQNPSNPFKTKITKSKEVLAEFCDKCLSQGIDTLVSEYIPGDDRSIVVCGGYSEKGKVFVYYTGGKISQRPKGNGVASMAHTIEEPELMELVAPFLTYIEYTGIFHFELKKGNNGNYYFIELNTRNWSWGYTATIRGRNFVLTKFYKETNSIKEAPNKGVPNFYFWLEGIFYNLVLDHWLGVLPRVFKMLFSKRITHAVFSHKDPLPYFISWRNLLLYFFRLRKIKR